MPLEGAYAFNNVGATTVTDLSGNGRHIDLTGSAGAQVTGGQTGGALGKTGATMPTLPASVLAACQTDDRTLMFDARGNLSTWWVRFNDPVFGSGMWGVLNLGSMAVQARDNTGSHNLATRPTATAPESGVWHNYCATYVRSTGIISIYRDGTLAATSSFAAGTQLSTTATSIDVAEWTDTGASVDNLRLLSHALTPSEVAALAGTPVTADFVLALTSAVEADAAQEFGATKARQLGPAAVVETAMPLGRHKSLALGTAYELDTALLVGHGKTRALTAAVETDTARPAGAAKTGAIGTASETDTALGFAGPMAAFEGPLQVDLPEQVSSVGVGPLERVDLVHVDTT